MYNHLMLPPALSKADMHLLYVFSAVAEARGFSAAQIALNVSPSTISRQVSDLETRLGMRLCHRGRNGFRLTGEGEIVLAAARKLFSALDRFGDIVDGTRNRLAGRLTVAVIDNWALSDEAPIMAALTRFVEAAPEVSLELHTLAPGDIEIAIQDGNAAIGVGVFHRHKPGLIYETLCVERVGLYCGVGHPLFDAGHDGGAERLVRQAKFACRAYLDEETVAPVSRGLESNAFAHQIEGIAMLILTGRYIGYLPRNFADVWVRRNRMKPVCGRRYEITADIEIARKRGDEPNLAASTFMDYLRMESARVGT